VNRAQKGRILKEVLTVVVSFAIGAATVVISAVVSPNVRVTPHGVVIADAVIETPGLLFFYAAFAMVAYSAHRTHVEVASFALG
jgi:vacuolar-type H+-ATPase subunit I/STV1